MSHQIASLVANVLLDPWRAEVGFTDEMELANKAIFESSSESDVVQVLSEWLQRYQPCVFGRIAAKFDFIEYCVLTEADLELSDAQIETKLQDARLRWAKKAHDGQRSNFIILLASPRLACALPNTTVAELSKQVCSHYLLTEAAFDVIHHDHIFLEKPGPARITWRWLAGVNYFAAYADKRWWHDHRIPGGIGFSTNSVGHLVKSEKVARKMADLNLEVGIFDEEKWDDSKVGSLGKALVLAMQTISNAAEAISGKATELLLLSEEGVSDLPKCPVKLPSSLVGNNYCEYLGYYHTDVTLPSVYFAPDVNRPSTIQPLVLDFTYLFHKSAQNPDYVTMGEGIRIRSDRLLIENPEEVSDYKIMRSTAADVSRSSYEKFLRKIEQRRSSTNIENERTL